MSFKQQLIVYKKGIYLKYNSKISYFLKYYFILFLIWHLKRCFKIFDYKDQSTSTLILDKVLRLIERI